MNISASAEFPIRKVLIANRGEIAVRVIRSCREMGIATVAVYSEADRVSPHVLMADECYALRGSSSAESYLDMEQILNVLRISGADAVHPGYGFLSENTKFAEAVEKAGRIFIGPDSASIAVMGDKTAAREAVRDQGVPLIPGSSGPAANFEEAMKDAERIGYPLLVKAAGGGGGKGMHRVDTPEKLRESFEKAKRESASAFGDDRVYLEKYISDPHHIEIQVLADTHGNIIHLNERECSIQRRFQKIIEESPSPLISDEQRQAMGEAAVRTARSCSYRGAGTVEFLADGKGHFYFLEMNTRLQVEHPVTEMVSGVDLVREQILIAGGLPLSYSQEDIRQEGHAIECRIYAEDSENNFMPSTGRIDFCRIPDGPGVRFDGALMAGQEITPYYDPMLGKLIVHHRDRESALSRMSRALKEFAVFGVETSIPFCLAVIEHDDFRSGNYNTHFIENHIEDLNSRGSSDDLARSAGLAAVNNDRLLKPLPPADTHRKSGMNPWKIRNLKF